MERACGFAPASKIVGRPSDILACRQDDQGCASVADRKPFRLAARTALRALHAFGFRTTSSRAKVRQDRRGQPPASGRPLKFRVLAHRPWRSSREGIASGFQIDPHVAGRAPLGMPYRREDPNRPGGPRDYGGERRGEEYGEQRTHAAIVSGGAEVCNGWKADVGLSVLVGDKQGRCHALKLVEGRRLAQVRHVQRLARPGSPMGGKRTRRARCPGALAASQPKVSPKRRRRLAPKALSIWALVHPALARPSAKCLKRISSSHSATMLKMSAPSPGAAIPAAERRS